MIAEWLCINQLTVTQCKTPSVLYVFVYVPVGFRSVSFFFLSVTQLSILVFSCTVSRELKDRIILMLTMFRFASLSHTHSLTHSLRHLPTHSITHPLPILTHYLSITLNSILFLLPLLTCNSIWQLSTCTNQNALMCP